MAVSILYSINDGKGKSSSTEVNLPSSVTLTNMTLFAAEMAKLINDMITGAITRIGIVISVPLPNGLRVTPALNSDVEEGGRFQFRTAGGFFTSNRIPTFSETFVSPGSQEIDTTDPVVAPFVTAMVSGINLVPVGGTATVAPTDKREADVVALEFAKEAFQSSRGE